MIEFSEFEKVDIRVGRITRVEDFPEARKPAFKLWIDFGSDIGVRTSSAQITKHYTKETLMNLQVIGVVNLPKKNIARFSSEVLTLGLPDENDEVILLVPTKEVPVGGKLF